VPIYTDPGNAPAGGGSDDGPAVPNYNDPGSSSSTSSPASQGAGTGTAGGKSGGPAVPDYSDPGESAPSNSAAPK
jgi:phospholipid-binding lipoprotein MlaA